MRKLVASLAVVVVVGALSPVAGASAASAGQACKKLGSVSGTTKKQMVCKRKGSRKIWQQVVVKIPTTTVKPNVPVSNPSVTTSPVTTSPAINSSNPTSTSVASTIVPLTCATGGTCQVGDTGPGGGIVFYADASRPAGSRYFEAACSGWKFNCDTSADPTASWDGGFYLNNYFLIGASQTALGTGKQNSDAIVAGCNIAGIAVRIVRAYSRNGLQDWFLPSKDELHLMYANLKTHNLGGFSSDNYWSSSESSIFAASFENFYFPYQDNGGKALLYRVRPVRSF